MDNVKEASAGFAVPILCRLLKANFGAQATEEALRHVVAARVVAHRDVAEAWANVLQAFNTLNRRRC